jgi:hypothetical protein
MLPQNEGIAQALANLWDEYEQNQQNAQILVIGSMLFSHEMPKKMSDIKRVTVDKIWHSALKCIMRL